MTYKFPSLALLATLTTAALAQTTAPTSAPHTTTAKTTATTTTTHHAATTAAAKSASAIPKVVGIPKTLFALKYIDSRIGTGPLAEPTMLGTSQADSKVMFYTVRYTGWLPDGTKFDSSFDHPGGEPITFPVGVRRVIIGWDTGFEGMHVGGKRRLFVPYQLAYGDKGRSPIPSKADLIFDVELVSQSDTPPAPPKPPTPSPDSTAPKPESAPGSSAPAAQPATPATPAQPQTPTQPQTPPHPQSF